MVSNWPLAAELAPLLDGAGWSAFEKARSLIPKNPKT